MYVITQFRSYTSGTVSIWNRSPYTPNTTHFTAASTNGSAGSHYSTTSYGVTPVRWWDRDPYMANGYAFCIIINSGGADAGYSSQSLGVTPIRKERYNDRVYCI